MADSDARSSTGSPRFVPYHRVPQIRRRVVEAEQHDALARQFRATEMKYRQAAARAVLPAERQRLLGLAVAYVEHEKRALELMPSTAERAAIDEFRRHLCTLFGFDVDDVPRRFHNWLFQRGFERRTDDGHFLGGAEPKTDSATKRKAKGLRTALRTLLNFEHMYGLERIAAARWHEQLQRMRRALERFEGAARVRAEETAFFASRAVGRASEVHARTAARTAALLTWTSALRRRVADAKRRIVRYEHDPLQPVDVEGRPRDVLLKWLEWTLRQAGFLPREIATLVHDRMRMTQGNSGTAKRAHHVRIRRRIERYDARQRELEVPIHAAAPQRRVKCAEESHGKSRNRTRSSV